MTRVTLAALAAVALASAPAEAQRARTVQGAGDFNAAPVLSSGRYKDTLRPGEQLYYAVELQTGQSFVAKVVIHRDGQNLGTLPFVDLQSYNPSRTELFDAAYMRIVAINEKTKVKVTTRAVGETKGDAEDPKYAQPGTYYFSLSFTKRVKRVQLRTDITVDVRGEPVVASSPTPSENPTPSDSPSPDETEDPAGAAGGSGTGSSDQGSGYLRVGLLAFLIGLLAGAVGRFVRPSRA